MINTENTNDRNKINYNSKNYIKKKREIILSINDINFTNYVIYNNNANLEERKNENIYSDSKTSELSLILKKCDINLDDINEIIKNTR